MTEYLKAFLFWNLCVGTIGGLLYLSYKYAPDIGIIAMFVLIVFIIPLSMSKRWGGERRGGDKLKGVDRIFIGLVAICAVVFLTIAFGDMRRLQQEMDEVQARLDEIGGNVGIYIPPNKYPDGEEHSVGIHIGKGFNCAIEIEGVGCLTANDEGFAMFVPTESFPKLELAP